MTQDKRAHLSQLILESARDAVADAIERHRRLGESIVISRAGQPVEISAEEIPSLQLNGTSKRP
jgi:hypothetical protein